MEVVILKKSSQFARLFPPFRSRRLAQFEVLAGRIGVIDFNGIFWIENALFPVAVLIPEEAVYAVFEHDAHPCIHQRQTRTAMKPTNAIPAMMNIATPSARERYIPPSPAAMLQKSTASTIASASLMFFAVCSIRTVFVILHLTLCFSSLRWR